MRSMLRIGAVIGAVAILAGCENFQNVIQKVSVEPAVKSNSKDVLDVVNLDTYPEGSSGAPYYNNPNADEKMRNDLQEAIIARSEVTCADFRKQLFATHVVRKVGLQSLALVLTGAAAAVGGEAAKTALAAAGAAVQGIDETVDAEALQKNAITAVLNTITSERTKLLAEMRARVGQTPEKYPIKAAVTDAIRYNNICSLTEALSVLGTSVEQKNAAAKTIKEMRISLARVQLARAIAERQRLPAGSAGILATTADNKIKRAETVLNELLGINP